MDVSYLSTAQRDKILYFSESTYGKYSTLKCLVEYGILESAYGQLTEKGRQAREVLIQSETGIEDISNLTREKARIAFRGFKACYSDADSAYKRGLVSIARYSMRKARLYEEIVQRYLEQPEQV